MSILFNILTLLFIVVSVALVLIVLVQRPQGGGLTGAFGGGEIKAHSAHYDADIGDGTHRLFVRLDDGSEVPLDGPQCDPAQPTAGCWSEVA
mgnify:CR=1 FL=1